MNPDKKPIVPIYAVIILLLFGVSFAIWYPDLFPDWTGFKGSIDRSTTQEIIPNTKVSTEDGSGTISKTTITDKNGESKTLWDWMSLLLAPGTLAALGFWFNSTQEQARVKRENIEQEQAAATQREEALEHYLDNLSKLLVENNLRTLAKKKDKDLLTEEEEKYLLDVGLDIVRARTLSILRRLDEDGKRKGSVIRFLIDIELISKVDLSEANLNGADLSLAKLSKAQLRGAELNRANLNGANLNVACLSGAKLDRAELNKAILSHANLNGASLNGTTLKNAHLRGTLLRGAKGLDPTQVKTAKNWELAKYDPELRKQLGLTSELTKEDNLRGF
jgi:Pentapeptide repeats (8 copies)